jgi:hypothetical protein
MSSRTHRKALPLDHTGIHWGTGERHESGTRWEPDEWKRFETWACENGANKFQWSQAVEWCESGHRHRKNGPAVVFSEGRAEWWLNGIRHRENGPAVVQADGHKAWWLNGRRYTDGTFTVPYST